MPLIKPKPKHSSEFDPYCAFKDDAARCRALLYLNIRLGLTSLARWVLAPLAAAVLAMWGGGPLQEGGEKLIAKTAAIVKAAAARAGSSAKAAASSPSSSSPSGSASRR